MIRYIAITLNNGKANYHINQPYIDYIVKAGYTPLCIFNKEMCTDELIDSCMGLMLPGGIDIDPVFYGEDNENSYGVNPEKDELERDLLHRFTKKGKLVFGICRGFQLAVREKIEMIKGDTPFYYSQHINGHQTNDKNSVRRDVKTHNVLLNNLQLYKEGNTNVFVRRFVNSMHHQGVITQESTILQTNKNNEMEIQAKHGDITVTAFSSFGVNSASTKKKDRITVIEGMDIRFNNSVVRGVQWHPEELCDVDLLHAFFGKVNKDQEKNKAKEMSNYAV
jgi:gamma-glutamyl-gamma-aminobutyrate hydrolase PuuD